MILPSQKEHEFQEREAESQPRNYMKVIKIKAAEKRLEWSWIGWVGEAEGWWQIQAECQEILFNIMISSQY